MESPGSNFPGGRERKRESADEAEFQAMRAASPSRRSRDVREHERGERSLAGVRDTSPRANFARELGREESPIVPRKIGA